MKARLEITRDASRSIFGFAPWLAAAVWAALMLTTVPAPAHEVSWFSIDGGGGASSGGAYTVSGTIGQADAGRSSGGNFTVTGGFWAASTAASGPPPILQVMLAGGQIVLSWPAPSPGFTLEEADGLEPGQEWRVVSETPMLNLAGDRLTITVADGPGNKFYRLRHP